MKKILSVLLAMIMAAMVSVQAFAASTQKYVSEMVVATGSSVSAAKKKLTSSGYTPIGGNVNEGNKQAVVIGVKTTTDKSKAITDVAVMNMKGGYSFEDYENVLKEYKDKSDEMVNTLYDAVVEYRANYKAGKAKALLACEILNRFTDEDFTEGSNKLGDILADESTTKEQLSVIFMQATTLAVTAIESALALGCSTDWVNDFINAPTDEVYTADDDESARIVFSTMERFQNEISSFETIYNASNLGEDSTEDEWKAYYETLSEDDKMTVDNYANTYSYLKATEYKGGTLYDFFMQDLKELDNVDLYPVAKAMTKGQLAALPYSSLCNAFQFSFASDESVNAIKESLKDGETISVFDGVDRSIFTADGIALTNEALRQATSSSDTSWYKGGLSKKTETIFYSIIGAVAGIAAISFAICVAANVQVAAIESAAYAAGFANVGFIGTGIMVERQVEYTMAGMRMYTTVEGEVEIVNVAARDGVRAAATAESANSAWAAVAGAAKIITAVSIAVVIITIVIFLIEEYKAQNTKKVNYTVIPRIIVDQISLDDNSRKYTYYYAAKDTDGEYADLNAWGGAEWNALYYTKDADAGDPIIASAIVQETNTVSDTSYNVPVHAFGSAAAYNLNKYSGIKTETYMFIKSAPAASLTGTSLVSGTNAIFGAAGLLIGAIGMFIIMSVKGKKKAEA